MADYKDYIVRYDIIADVTKAAEGLQSIVAIAKEFEEPMNALKSAITQVSQSALQLKQNSQIKFAPTIETGIFKNQLRTMVTEVRSAAAEMHAAIFEALSGKAAGTKAVQKGINSALSGTRSVAAIDKDIASLEKSLDKLLGTPKKNKRGETIRNRDGSIYYTKNALAKANLQQRAIFEEKLTNLEGQKTALQNSIKQLKSERAIAEKLEKEAASAQTKKQSKVVATPSSKNTPAPKSVPLTNVTTDVIKAWQKAFGNARSKTITLNIKGNATGPNGALTVIDQVQKSLTTLQSLGTFDINPVLNNEGFAAAEAKLRQLAGLSAAVVAPFTPKETKTKTGKTSSLVSSLTKDEKTKLNAAQKQIKAWNEKIATLQSRLNTNQAIPEDQRTPAIKGQITRDTKNLAAYQANKAEQENIVKSLQGKSTAAAQSAVKTAKPFAIDIVGNISKFDVIAKPPVVPIVGEVTKIQSKVTEAIPVNVKISGEQIAASKAPVSTAPAPTPHPVYTPPTFTAADEKQLNSLAAKYGSLATARDKAEKTMASAKAKLEKSGGSNHTCDRYMAAQRKHSSLRQQAMDVYKQLQPLMFKQFQSTAQRALTDEELMRGIDAQNVVNQLSAKKRLTAAQKTQLAEANQTLTALRAPAPASTTPAPASSKPAPVVQPTKIQKAPSKTAITATVDTQNIISQIQSIPKQTIPVSIKLMWKKGAVGRQEQIKKLTTNIPPIKLYLDASPAVLELEEFISQIKAASPQNIKLTAAGVGTNTTPTTSATNSQKPGATGGTTQRGAKQNGHTGHQALTPRQYRDQLGAHLAKGGMLPPNFATQIADQQRRRAWQLAQMRRDATSAFASPTPYEIKDKKAQAQNAMLPFAKNKEQLNMLTKHRRYFRQAVAATGIMPTPGMEAPRMLQYLQGVSSQMQKASVAVPWTLQSQINKLEGDIAKANGVGQPTQSRGTGMVPMRTDQQRPFYERARKIAYPLTGQSSFGARTPMAVEMAKGMGVMFAIDGAMSAIGSSFSQAMEYQNTMRTTQAILQNGTESYTQDSFKNMEATVRDVGVKTKFSAPEVANAARFLAMAGYDIEAINDAIRPIADLALIGDTDLGETADKMTNIMTTFQIAPERMREAANIMATTATRSNTDLMMLAESAKYGGAVANMYGRNDPYLFADTMAIFGVMGNAGIQASSAGTALRMMYQNIFNPNKKQAAILQHLNDQYGISTVDANGQKRSMADIIIDMANQIPDDVMPDIVGKLFRITAQSGANSAIVSAKDIALEAAGGDANIATQLIDETNELVDKLSNKKNSKKQLSSLASLIQANRNSMNGNISGAIAEEKQNTIAGLWAQVTSTFTEGIVKSFENRQGGFEGMLKQLRDYLAKPETVQMMQNLMDMIVEIGKVLAWFVKIWASLYNAAPNLITFWVKWQMIFTQIGSLILPLIQLTSVFATLKSTISGFLGLTMASGVGSVATRVAGGTLAGSVASSAALNAPFIVGSGKFGTNKVIRGNIAARAHNAMAANAILAGELALSGANRESTLASLNKDTRQHYAAVRKRAKRIYGPARAGRAFKAAFYAVPTMATFAPMFGGLKTMLIDLLTGLAKAAGFLVNPVTLAVGALTGLGFGLYKLKQRIDGTTEAQQIAAQKAKAAAQSTVRELNAQGKWHNELGADRVISGSVIHEPQSEEVQQYLKDQERFKQSYEILWNNLAKDANKESISDTAAQWRGLFKNNSHYKNAFGDRYDELVGAGLTKWTNSNLMWNHGPSDVAGLIHDIWVAQDDHAIDLQKRMVQGALMIEGANSDITQKYVNDIIALRKRVINKEITEAQYKIDTQAILDKVKTLLPETALDASNMTPEELKNTSNRAIYAPYQDAIFNVLNAYIKGNYGTDTGALNAWHDLTNRNEEGKLTSGLDEWSKAWYAKLANIAKDLQLTDTFFSPDGLHQENMKIILSMMPDTGKIDMSFIQDQVRQKIKGFQLTLQQFSDMLSSVYDILKEIGVIDQNDNNKYNFIRSQLTGNKFTSDTVHKYYQDYIATNLNSEWNKAGISENDYVNWMMGVKGAMSDLDISKKLGRTITRSQENSQMATNIAHKAAKFGNQKAVINTPQTPTTPQNTPTPTPSPAKDQQAYASAYDRAAARPTQVVFNINNLASFDRTTVASSAEERDLIASMEERITGAVYQMFAEASNQAQRVMDLT